MNRPNAYLELDHTGRVINMIVWDGLTPYNPPGVAQLLKCDENPGVGIGWQLVDGEWISPTSSQETGDDNGTT